MKLYLVQHGKAEDKAVDPARPLTAAGASDVEAMAALLEKMQPSIAEVWHSGKERARQTAEILAARMAGAAIAVEHAGLAPNDPVAPVCDALAAREEDLMLVGHLPFLAKLAGCLLTGDAQRAPVAFQMGGMVCLERKAGAWAVQWMVTPAFFAQFE